MTDTSTFGPSALMTPANGITLARLLATPVLVLLIVLSGPGWAPFAVALAVIGTDGIDGWIARRQGETRSGAFLDPLADKVVVLGALAAVADRGELSWWPVALIAAREVSMSIYRSAVGRRGVSIPARTSAKIKTLVQDVLVGLCLVPTASGHHGLLTVTAWVAVAFTIGTGAQYVADGRRSSQAAGVAAGTVTGGGPTIAGGPVDDVHPLGRRQGPDPGEATGRESRDEVVR